MSLRGSVAAVAIRIPAETGKNNFLRIERKYYEIFVIFSKITIDKRPAEWYHNRARVGTFCACTAMMQEIAPKKR